MPNALSLAALTAIHARETADGVITLCTIESPELQDDPYRLAMSSAPVVSNGMTFIPYDFDVILPQDERDNQPAGQIVFSNINPVELIPWMSALREPPLCTIQLVRKLNPNDILRTYHKFTLGNRVYDVSTIQCTLVRPDLTRKPYPKDAFSPSTAPGLRWST
jgi:hypothetical protein